MTICNSVEASAADREPSQRDNEHYVKCKAKCCKFCSYCARAFSKERNKSRGSRLLLKEKQIKVCEKCFLCHSIVLCQLCSKCSQCCHKSACRGQTPKLLEKVVRSGCQSESGPNLERGLHPPLSDPAKLVKTSHSHKLLWQSSQKSETIRDITSAYRQKCHRTGPTDTGPVAKPTRKDTGTACPPGVFGKGVHVLDRPINSHRKAGLPRQITHEANSMAPQKQLENTRIPRKGDSSTQVFTSPFTMVATGKQCPHWPTITPHATCSANLYRRIKRRVGRSLKRVHCQKKLVPTGKQATHKLSGAQSGFSSLTGVSRSVRGQNGSCSN